MTFTFNRIKPYIPKIIISFVCSFILLNGLSVRTLLSNSTVAELFQLNIIGYPYSINSSWWYLSALIFITFIIYPFLSKNKESFGKNYSPLIIIGTLALVQYNNINLSMHSGISYLFMDGLYCGLIYMNLGIIAYNLSKYLKEKTVYDKNVKELITLTEIFGYVFVLVNTYYNFSGSIAIALVLLFAISISFSGKSYTSEIFNYKVFDKLATFGFTLYLNNIAVRTFILNHHCFDKFSYSKKLLIFILLVLILSLLVTYLEKLYKIIKKYRKEIKI